MAGPARALNTIGGQVTWQATAFGAIVAGLMSMFLVGRHTRAEEESGRDELVRAAAVGRLRADDGRPGHGPARQPRPRRPGRRSAWSPTRSRSRTPSALGVGLTLVRLGLHRHRPGRRAAHLQHPLDVRPRRRLHRPHLRAAGGRRRRQPRAHLAVADRVVPGHARVLRAALVAGAAPPRRRPRRPRRRRTPSSGAATSAPACSPPARDPPGPAGACAAGSGWPGASSAARSSAGRSGCSSSVLAYGSIGDDVGDLVGDSGPTREMFAQGGAALVDGVLRHRDADAGADRRAGSRSPRRCARAARRTTAASRPCSRPRCRRDRWLLGHIAVTVLGALLVLAARRPRPRRRLRRW